MKKEQNLKDLFIKEKDGYIPVSRMLSRVLGFNATGLLAELCDKYDWYSEQEQLNQYEEFYYTVANCEINTGLSKREQLTAITKLIEYGFIENTTSRGMPKLRYFKLSNNIPNLIEKLWIESEEKKSKISERNKISIGRLDKP